MCLEHFLPNIHTYSLPNLKSVLKYHLNKKILSKYNTTDIHPLYPALFFSFLARIYATAYYICICSVMNFSEKLRILFSFGLDFQVTVLQRVSDTNRHSVSMNTHAHTHTLSLGAEEECHLHAPSSDF